MRIALLIALFLPGWLSAQSPFFKTHNLSEAWPTVKIERMYEDRNSLLWFGSSEGLFFFDGLEFLPFLKKDSSSDHVRAIYQDGKMRHWIGYEDGSVYQMERQQLRPWVPEEGSPASPVTGFTEDGEDRLWIATYGEGVYCLNDGRLINFNTDDGILGDDIYVMVKDKQGRIWLGTDGGISICSMVNGQKKVENLTRKDGLPDDIVREILPDAEGNMWVGMYDEGVCLYNFSKKAFEYPLKGWKNGIVNNLELFEGKELWIGTEGNGIWRFSLPDKKLHPLTGEERLTKARIYDLHKDIEGNIWVVSNTHGVCSANRQFEFVKTDFENIQALHTDLENNIWVGTADGLYTHQIDALGQSYFTRHLKNLQLNVLSLYEDRFGNLWIGTFGQGIYCYDPENGKVRHLAEKDGLTNGNVLSMDGTNGHVWAATLGGVTEFSFSENILEGGKLNHRNFNQESGLGTNFIYKVFIDSKNRTWFGTDGKGVSVLENGTIKNYPAARHAHANVNDEDDSRLKAVYSIAEDRQGHIWISTDRQGIYEFDGKKFSHLTVKEGIRDLAITSLITDANGKILIVHPSGIDLLIPETHHLIYYDEEVGIKDIDPNLNAVCTDRLGNCWAGVRRGLIKYTPLKENLEIHPRTRINSVSIFLEPIDFEKNNSFGHAQNNLIFDYTGLWYTDPAVVKYRYQLEGYDLGWISSKDRRATYSNLPPGKYTFKVTSTENDAWLDEPVITYAFEVLQPIWRRWWFVSLCALAIAGGFFWYQKARDARVRRVSLLEKEKAESDLAALKAQINPHFLFNSFNTLVTVIEEDPPVAVEYVEKLSDFYRSMMQLRDREVISLQEEVELVQNYSYLLQKRYGNNFHLQVNLNGESAYVIPLTLQILVENAVKHNVISKSKPLTVSISMEDKDYLVVSNNLQLKIITENSTRFGLESLIRRYELLNNKKVKIEETASEFRVGIPVIR